MKRATPEVGDIVSVVFLDDGRAVADFSVAQLYVRFGIFRDYINDGHGTFELKSVTKRGFVECLNIIETGHVSSDHVTPREVLNAELYCRCNNELDAERVFGWCIRQWESMDNPLKSISEALPGGDPILRVLASCSQYYLEKWYNIDPKHSIIREALMRKVASLVGTGWKESDVFSTFLFMRHKYRYIFTRTIVPAGEFERAFGVTFPDWDLRSTTPWYVIGQILTRCGGTFEQVVIAYKTQKNRLDELAARREEELENIWKNDPTWSNYLRFITESIKEHGYQNFDSFIRRQKSTYLRRLLRGQCERKERPAVIEVLREYHVAVDECIEHKRIQELSKWCTRQKMVQYLHY